LFFRVATPRSSGSEQLGNAEVRYIIQLAIVPARTPTTILLLSATNAFFN